VSRKWCIIGEGNGWGWQDKMFTYIEIRAGGGLCLDAFDGVSVNPERDVSG